MDIKQIIDFNRPANEIIAALQRRSYYLPSWEALRKEYDPEMHEVVKDPTYVDRVKKNGVEKVTRITYDLQRLAVKRMTELCYGIPVKRIYKTDGDERKQAAADLIDRIFKRARIDAVNLDRAHKLFASCEVLTLWYGVRQDNYYYGKKSDIKVRCSVFSPMDGDRLYPLFDEYGDMLAMSVGYTRRVGDKDINYFDTYTADKHYRWCDEATGTYVLTEDEDIEVGKIPAVYTYRPTPIWEQTTRLVNEMEWSMSRNGNYLRKNSRPILGVFADEAVPVEQSPTIDKSDRDVVQLPQGSNLAYVTWNQAIENLKFHLTELRQQFFTQLQLPDWSYESMKSTPMSGESRKQLFIDAQLKVKDESGRLLEMHDREVNVIKAFAKAISPELEEAIDQLEVENVITPFTLTSQEDEVGVLATATAGKAIMSQRTAIEKLGMVRDADKELEQIAAENAVDAMESAF